MRYVIIVWLVVFGLLFLLTGQSKAETFEHPSKAGERYSDPKWHDYMMCVGYIHIIADQIIVKAKDQIDRQLALELARANSINFCKTWLPK